jgi:hypothetical protein
VVVDIMVGHRWVQVSTLILTSVQEFLIITGYLYHNAIFFTIGIRVMTDTEIGIYLTIPSLSTIPMYTIETDILLAQG